jgi:hypothetical protein
MTKLSPAGQAVMDAYNEIYESDRHAVAAALRAAAPQMEFVQDHLKLLAVAAELDGANNTINQEDYE